MRDKIKRLRDVKYEIISLVPRVLSLPLEVEERGPWERGCEIIGLRSIDNFSYHIIETKS